PVPFDPDASERKSTAKFGIDHTPGIVGLLIGGNAGTFSYVRAEWERLLTFVREMHVQCGTRWMVANSRRTPQWVSEPIVKLATDQLGLIAAFIDVGAGRGETLERLWSQCDAVVCTADSSSMITEAI